MQKIYDKIFLFGVHAHIILDQILVWVGQQLEKKNGHK